MNSKNIFLDYGCNRKEIKKISEKLPDGGITIFVLALHIKPIILSDSSELVISSNEDNFIRKLKFKEAEKSNCFYTVGASVNIVSKK